MDDVLFEGIRTNRTVDLGGEHYPQLRSEVLKNTFNARKLRRQSQILEQATLRIQSAFRSNRDMKLYALRQVKVNSLQTWAQKCFQFVKCYKHWAFPIEKCHELCNELLQEWIELFCGHYKMTAVHLAAKLAEIQTPKTLALFSQIFFNIPCTSEMFTSAVSVCPLLNDILLLNRLVEHDSDRFVREVLGQIDLSNYTSSLAPNNKLYESLHRADRKMPHLFANMVGKCTPQSPNHVSIQLRTLREICSFGKPSQVQLDDCFFIPLFKGVNWHQFCWSMGVLLRHCKVTITIEIVASFTIFLRKMYKETKIALPPKAGSIQDVAFPVFTSLLTARLKFSDFGSFSVVGPEALAALVNRAVTIYTPHFLPFLLLMHKQNARHRFVPQESFYVDSQIITAPILYPFEKRCSMVRNSFDAKIRVRPRITGPLRIKRSRIFEDGCRFSSIYDESRQQVSFVSEFGYEEAGIDGGAMFKEFLHCMIREGTSKLFVCKSEDLHPDPNNNSLHEYEMLGRAVGKALYEGVLVDQSYSPTFIQAVLGKITRHTLAALDPQLYGHLDGILKTECVESLNLTFSVNYMCNHIVSTYDLVDNGREVWVTAQNRREFVKKYISHLNSPQAKAFGEGLRVLVNQNILNMFTAHEFLLMLCGDGSFDIEDMKTHMQYAGGYHAKHPVVMNFWKAIESYSSEEQSKFLMFVTGSPRPPSSGFSALNPKLTLRNTGDDQRRLPSASACANLLKLPSYNTYELLREKLLYSLSARSGFDFS